MLKLFFYLLYYLYYGLTRGVKQTLHLINSPQISQSKVYSHGMSALIIDTSAAEGVVACVKDGSVIQSWTLPQGRALSKSLFPLLQTIANEKFDFIAVGRGPGTFTGTRVGAMAAQALAFGWKIPLFGFSSTLLPDLAQIAREMDENFRSGATSSQIELVYISPTS